MSGNGKASESKKSGNKNISTPLDKLEDKILYWGQLIQDKYEDPEFYLLQHEYNKIFRAFLSKENVLFSPSPIFTYKGKKFECENHILTLTYSQFETTNRIVVFHDFIRGKRDGEIRVLATPIIFD